MRRVVSQAFLRALATAALLLAIGGAQASAATKAVLVKDIVPGAADSDPYDLRGLTAVNGTVFFVARDFELWKSDGTAKGTKLVKEIRSPHGNGCAIDDLTNVNGTLVFVANDGHGNELWKSDGTARGTAMLRDINPTAACVPARPRNLTLVDGTLFFNDYGGLWKSDGTAAGTTLVGPFEGEQLTNVAGTLFLLRGCDLWKSDGTAAGTTLVKEDPGSLCWYQGPRGEGVPSAMVDVTRTLFFQGYDDGHGFELWKSDGTAAGTTLVKDINSGPASSQPDGLTNVGGTLFFIAADFQTGRTGLWKSDGTEEGTTPVENIACIRSGTNVSGTLFFVACDAEHGAELWKSDHTGAGMTLVKDINPGPYGSNPYKLTNVNGTLFFSAIDEAHGDEIWKSDGTARGTTILADINPGPADSLPYYASLTSVHGTLFFIANDGVHGYELWKTKPRIRAKKPSK